MNLIDCARVRHPRLWATAALLVGAFALTATAPPAAASEPAPKTVTADAMDWWSVDAGGGRSGGGTWAVISSIGQADAGTLTGGVSTLDGGFVIPDVAGEPPLFADGFETGSYGAWSSVTPDARED